MPAGLEQGYLSLVYMSGDIQARGIEEYPRPATTRKCIKKTLIQVLLRLVPRKTRKHFQAPLQKFTQTTKTVSKVTRAAITPK